MFVLHKSKACERFNKILNNTCNRKQSQNDWLWNTAKETQLKMLLVKILAENIDMKLPITLEEFSSHTINKFSSGYREYISVWTVAIPYFVGENLSMNTRSML